MFIAKVLWLLDRFDSTNMLEFEDYRKIDSFVRSCLILFVLIVFIESLLSAHTGMDVAETTTIKLN